MAKTILKVLNGANIENPFYIKLKENIELKEINNVSDIKSGDFVIVDAKKFIYDLENKKCELNKCLKHGGSILFLDVESNLKKILGKYIGVHKEGDSIALFIKHCGYNRYVMHNLSYEENYFRKSYVQSRKSDIKSGSNRRSGIKKRFITKSIIELFYGDIIEAHLNKEKANKNFSEKVRSKQWLYTEYYNWGARESLKWEDYIPKTQDLLGRITYTLMGIKETSVKHKTQWLFMENKGVWYTSKTASGMNQDWHDERGWAIGSIKLQIGTPVDNGIPFKTYDCSPKKINNSKIYETNVNFDIAHEEERFSFSKSIIEEISDWKISLSGKNNWTFQQRLPYDGDIENFPESSIDYNSKNARYEIKPLPEISKRAVKFNTMSVWFNNRVSTDEIKVNLKLKVKYNYEAIKNNWPDFDGVIWCELIEKNETFIINF